LSLATLRGLCTGVPVQRPCIESDSATSIRLLGQFEPVTGHTEEEDPAVHVANLLCEFDAVGGIEAVTGDRFPTHQTFPRIFWRPTCLLTYDISGSGPFRSHDRIGG
jgi:hypothetical protein